MTTIQVAIRLPRSQVDRVDELVGGVHESRSDVIRRALELYLYRLECERDARRYDEMPLSDDELSFADDPRAQASMPEW